MLLTVYKFYPVSMNSAQEKRLMKGFGRQVAELRRSKGVTQQQLAQNIGMSVVAIAYIETGKRWARLETLDKIAKELEVDIADFFKKL